MTILSTAAVGLLCLLIGICLSALALTAFLLHRAAVSLRDQTHRQHQTMTNQLTRNSAEVYQLKLEVAAGFVKLDSDSLREAAVSISRTGKNLAATTSMLYKLVLSQPGAGDVVEDVLSQDIPQNPMDTLSHDRAQAMINDIQRRAGVPQGEPGPAQQPPMDLEQAWMADEGEFR